eukprot:c29175_g1_i5 orf=574-738(-)
MNYLRALFFLCYQGSSQSLLSLKAIANFVNISNQSCPLIFLHGNSDWCSYLSAI